MFVIRIKLVRLNFSFEIELSNINSNNILHTYFIIKVYPKPLNLQLNASFRETHRTISILIV